MLHSEFSLTVKTPEEHWVIISFEHATHSP